ncbi:MULTISPECIES: hypothetical protein [unclassified Agromyces]|uniref:hypothetical protein n=1 Tax=unclassified Agromyces TaxID=2639701 RepID=UPI00301527E7
MAASGTAEPGTIGRAAAPPGDPGNLADAVIAEELRALRQAFGDGAEFALTRAGRRDETLHRLECPALEPHLDRAARWTDEHRRRLARDPAYRLALPELLTRERALGMAGTHGCRVCWPNITGAEARPLKRLTARGLGSRHAGRVLATETGESLGTIIRVTALTGADLFGVERDEIEVMTSARAVRYAPPDPVHLWDLPGDAEAIGRRMRLLARLGTAQPPAV